MKSSCAILLFCVLVYVEAHGKEHGKFREAKQKCMGDLGLDESVIKPFFHDATLDTSDENVKCFFRCFMQELNKMDANGNITPPQDNHGPPEMAQAFAECATVTGSNDCDKAWNFHKCFVARKPARHSH